jgi:tRNA dimethylallyltransferase
MRVPFITGPTAVGKTEVGIRLAEKFNKLRRGPAEIINADAFLVYKGMNVGTAKPTRAEMRNIPHHLISVVEADARYSVQEWINSAKTTQRHISHNGGMPIFVGGTHMYAKAYMDGLEDAPGRDDAYRAELMRLHPCERFDKLQLLCPEAASKVHPNDEKRVVRALEKLMSAQKISGLRATGDNTIIARDDGWQGAAPERDSTFLVNLTVDRDDYPQFEEYIGSRTNEMVDSGLEGEVLELLCDTLHPLSVTARMAIGYNEMIPYVQRKYGDRIPAANRVIPTTRRMEYMHTHIHTLDDAIEHIKRNTFILAKKQMKWSNAVCTNGHFLQYQMSHFENPSLRLEKIDELVDLIYARLVADDQGNPPGVC